MLEGSRRVPGAGLGVVALGGLCALLGEQDVMRLGWVTHARLAARTSQRYSRVMVGTRLFQRWMVHSSRVSIPFYRSGDSLNAMPAIRPWA